MAKGSLIFVNSFIASTEQKKKSAVIKIAEPPAESTGYTSTGNWVDKLNTFYSAQVRHSSGTFDMHSFPSALLLNEEYQEKYKTNTNEYYLAAVCREREEIKKENKKYQEENNSDGTLKDDVIFGPLLPENNIAYEEICNSEINHTKGARIYLLKHGA